MPLATRSYRAPIGCAPYRNLLSRVHVTRRVWSGVCVDVTEAWGNGEACADLGYESSTSLWALMEEVGGAHSEARFKAEQPCPVSYTPRNMHFAPRGLAAWGYCADMGYIRDVTLVFDLDDIECRWSEKLDHGLASVPRWRFANDDLWTLIRMLADSVGSTDPTTELYGDGLVTAILARVVRRSAEIARRERGLARWQLCKVLEYLNAQLPDPVQLSRWPI